MGPSHENPGQAPDSVRIRVARPLGGGNCTTRGSDMPATRRPQAACRAKPLLATGLEGAGGSGGPEGLAAVPGAAGPGRSTRKRQQHPAQANFACNSPTTWIDAHSKPQNINDQTSILEICSAELHAKLMGERPVGPQAASHRRACPLSGRSAARLCHVLVCSPGAPRRPTRTRRGRTQGRSTGRRAPWPRSCRAP